MFQIVNIFRTLINSNGFVGLSADKKDQSASVTSFYFLLMSRLLFICTPGGTNLAKKPLKMIGSES